MGFTDSLTVNGKKNLFTLLKAAGYADSARVETEATIYNTSVSVACYLHFSTSNETEPGGTTNGLPILTGAPSGAFSLPKGADLSLIWLYTASSISVTVGVI
jgi:hypothetical protein